jgi:polar amino acid transport system substrate-binding protein
MRKISGYLAITLLAIAVALAAWYYAGSGGERRLPRWSGGEIRVGYSSEPPYAFRADTGEVTGEAPEIAKAMLARLGITRIRWVLMDFSQTIPALLSGHIDMIANGMFVTSERAAMIDFSLPYARVRQGLLTRRGNPASLHAYADVAARDKVRVAVLDGAIEQQILRRLGVPAQRLFVVPEPLDGLAAVRQGRADCLALTAPTITWLAATAPEEVEAAKPFQEPSGEGATGSCAFGFRREDRNLREAVDRALRAYIGTPEHLEEVAPFGFGRASLPDWVRS